MKQSTQKNGTGRRTGLSRKVVLWSAAISLGVGALLGALVAFGSASRSDSSIASCGDREVIVGLSSADRSPELQKFAVDAITQEALSAAVCDGGGEAYGVAGGGQVLPLLTSDDVNHVRPMGPNREARLSRLDANAETDLRKIVANRLQSAYKTTGTIDTSSISALYEVASEHATHNTDVLIVTSGLQHDEQLDLNRPLAAGEGARLATSVTVPSIRNERTTVVGVSQVDAEHPAPGPSWPTEIRSFNAALCHRTGASNCRIYSAASVTEAFQTS